ncbi:DUF4492 domain-containing protein [bacterium]|nr:DUF4492 domain-containing protein [bacterium]MBU1957690.1 DUF4492 domain-containing protein [bacterium]
MVKLNKPNFPIKLKKIFQFYLEGFKNMRVGKTLWGIIAIKFFLFFFIMKILFFPNFLKENFDNDTQRANHILNELTTNLTKESK